MPTLKSLGDACIAVACPVRLLEEGALGRPPDCNTHNARKGTSGRHPDRFRSPTWTKQTL